MPSGKYFPFRRRKELEQTTSFTTVLQVWLAIFGFSVVGIGLLFEAIRGLIMLNDISAKLPPWVFSFSFGILVAFIVIFVAVAIYAATKTVQLFINALVGQRIEYDLSSTPIHILKAIEPIRNRGDLIAYKEILKRLIDENNKLITKYYSIVNELEKKDGHDDPKGYDPEFNEPKL